MYSFIDSLEYVACHSYQQHSFGTIQGLSLNGSNMGVRSALRYTAGILNPRVIGQRLPKGELQDFINIKCVCRTHLRRHLRLLKTPSPSLTMIAQSKKRNLGN